MNARELNKWLLIGMTNYMSHRILHNMPYLQPLLFFFACVWFHLKLKAPFKVFLSEWIMSNLLTHNLKIKIRLNVCKFLPVYVENAPKKHRPLNLSLPTFLRPSFWKHIIGALLTVRYNSILKIWTIYLVLGLLRNLFSLSN